MIRKAGESDMAIIQAIYAEHVLNGTGTFEELPPDEKQMTARWESIAARELPYLVAGYDAQVQGFAYVAPFRPRSAYRYSVEDSVYVHPNVIGGGLGRLLLGELIEQCIALGYRQMIAVIGDSANARSINLHSSHGFERTGLLRNAGFKFGRWLDAVFMQRSLGDGDRTTPVA
jgi:phosphinothricin acetyltransferase